MTKFEKLRWCEQLMVTNIVGRLSTSEVKVLKSMELCRRLQLQTAKRQDRKWSTTICQLLRRHTAKTWEQYIECSWREALTAKRKKKRIHHFLEAKYLPVLPTRSHLYTSTEWDLIREAQLHAYGFKPGRTGSSSSGNWFGLCLPSPFGNFCDSAESLVSRWFRLNPEYKKDRPSTVM